MAAPLARAEPSLHIEAISEELGLARVVVRGVEASAVRLVVDGGPQQLVCPMWPEGDRVWRTHVMIGAREFSVGIEADSPGGTWRWDPHAVELSVPEAQRVPAWALGATWYQIFPERFRNGEPANDPRGPGVFVKPWNSDWYQVSADELEAGWHNAAGMGRRALADAGRSLLGPVVYQRRYGGDLQGVVEQLDHIAALGVTAIYFTPIFASSSLHKYDASDYRHIDPAFGGRGRVVGTPARETDDPETWVWTDADRYFLDVVLPEAKRRGLRVVIDGVWNHVGLGFWAFRDIAEHGRASAYGEWFRARFSEPDDAEGLSGGRLIGWQGWDGRNGRLPEFVQIHGDLQPDVKRHIFEVTRRWMDPNGDGDPSDGVDGWRLDVAPEVGRQFWRDWRAHVRSINPDAVLIGEIWYDAGAWFDGTAFDAQMNYPFVYPVADWLGLQPRTTAQSAARRLESAFRHAARNDMAQMNLLGSHDTERFSSMLNNPGRGYDAGGRRRDGARYDDSRPPSEVFDRVVLGVAIAATYLGSPMIYNGDEWGMSGGDDPDNRKPIPWPDRPEQANEDDRAMLMMPRRFAKWLRLRRDPLAGEVLRFGDVRQLETDDPEVLGLVRTLNDRWVVVGVNRGDGVASLGRAWAGAVGEPGSLDLSIGPRSARAWVVRWVSGDRETSTLAGS